MYSRHCETCPRHWGVEARESFSRADDGLAWQLQFDDFPQSVGSTAQEVWYEIGLAFSAENWVRADLLVSQNLEDNGMLIKPILIVAL